MHHVCQCCIALIWGMLDWPCPCLSCASSLTCRTILSLLLPPLPPAPLLSPLSAELVAAAAAAPATDSSPAATLSCTVTVCSTNTFFPSSPRDTGSGSPGKGARGRAQAKFRRQLLGHMTRSSWNTCTRQTTPGHRLYGLRNTAVRVALQHSLHARVSKGYE